MSDSVALISDYRVNTSGQEILLITVFIGMYFSPAFLKLVNFFITHVHQLTGTTTISPGKTIGDSTYSPLQVNYI